MVEIIVPLGLFFSLAYAMVGVTRAITDSRVRRRLLESNTSPELAAAIVAPPHREPVLGDTLKWGLVVGAVGVALIVLQFLPFDADDPIASGILMLSAAIALLGYYRVARRMIPSTQTSLAEPSRTQLIESGMSEHV